VRIWLAARIPWDSRVVGQSDQAAGGCARAAAALPLRCAAGAVLCLIAVRKALLLSDARALLLLIPYKEYGAVGSACRTAVVLGAPGI
jgi:hypothetical protein